MEQTARIKSVAAGEGEWHLCVVWHDGKTSDIDLSRLVHSSKHFGRFLNEPEAFQKIAPVNFGSGVAWENGLDFSAECLMELREQA